MAAPRKTLDTTAASRDALGRDYCGAKTSMQPQPPPSALLGTKT